MSFTPKSDVKEHLLTHDRYARPLCQALTQPDAVDAAEESDPGNAAHLIPALPQPEDAELPFLSATLFMVPALSKSVSK